MSEDRKGAPGGAATRKRVKVTGKTARSVRSRSAKARAVPAEVIGDALGGEPVGRVRVGDISRWLNSRLASESAELRRRFADQRQRNAALVEWARARIAQCRREEEKFFGAGAAKRVGGGTFAAGDSGIRAVQERMTLQAVLRMLGVDDPAPQPGKAKP